jgi:hypothetical protein
MGRYRFDFFLFFFFFSSFSVSRITASIQVIQLLISSSEAVPCDITLKLKHHSACRGDTILQKRETLRQPTTSIQLSLVTVNRQ